ncbi:hypothetical protein NMY22_g10948 [Coprinellus aureogranulatus]|nr:hypothetical protein NMY22_g10948 [Coprinellus aureogranulatus]
MDPENTENAPVDLSRFTDEERDLLTNYEREKRDLESEKAVLLEKLKATEEKIINAQRCYGEIFNARSGISVLPNEILSTILGSRGPPYSAPNATRMGRPTKIRFTVGKEVEGDILNMLNSTSPADESVSGDYLPPFRAVFSPHDNPNLHSDWELRDEAIDAAKRGKYLDMTKEREHKLHGWKSACNPFSPAWMDPIPYSPYHPPVSDIFALKHESPFAHSPSRSPRPKTFIYNHRASMDPCLHPSHLLSHGQFLSHGTGPVPHRRLIPQFGYSPTTLHEDIMLALPFNWVADVLPREDDPPFHEKVESRLHWRGRNTGMWHGGEEQVEWSDDVILGKTLEDPQMHGGKLWWLSQRERLVDWANKMKEDVVPRPGVHQDKGAKAKVEEVESGIPTEMRIPPKYINPDPPPPTDKDAYPKVKNSKNHALRSTPNDLWAVGEQSQETLRAKWAPGMVDIAFAGDPINCEGRMCDRLREVYEFRKFHDGKTQGRYKYVMDVDGNGWSSRFKRLITSNAVIFKTTIYPEWYTDRVAPWLHYVPIQNDLSDLLDTLYFFRGDPSGNNAHEDLAEKIAREGREWSLKYWRMADMTAYTFRLFLEYARVMSEDRDVKVEVEMDEDMVVGDLVGRGAVPGRSGKVRVKVGKQDYVYREEDEYVAGEEGAGQKEWDWRYRQRVKTPEKGS